MEMRQESTQRLRSQRDVHCHSGDLVTSGSDQEFCWLWDELWRVWGTLPHLSSLAQADSPGRLQLLWFKSTAEDQGRCVKSLPGLQEWAQLSTG